MLSYHSNDFMKDQSIRVDELRILHPHPVYFGVLNAVKEVKHFQPLCRGEATSFSHFRMKNYTTRQGDSEFTPLTFTNSEQ